MTEQPAWLQAAWAEFGVAEEAGAETNGRVAAYFGEAGQPQVKDDVTPWCAAFVGAMLRRGGVSGTGSLLARSYLNWGEAIGRPRTGAIAVLSRGAQTWAGHTGFYVGEAGDRIFLLGGNQGDRVSVQAFDRDRLLGYRWPGPVGEGEVAAGESGDAAEGVATHEDVFVTALAHVLAMEGGFSNDPYDPGGPTNRGITLAEFARMRGETVTAINRARLIDDLKRISDDELSQIYRARYWEPAKCAAFAPALALMHFDAAVNHGVRGAAQLLQSAAGVSVDGEIGPDTMAGVARRSVDALLGTYAEARRRRYRQLAHFWRFGRGWLRRVDETLAAASRLAGASTGEAAVLHARNMAKGETDMADDGVATDNGGNPYDAEAQAKWWAHSKTVWGTLITFAATVLPVLGPLFGIHIPGEIIRQIGELGVESLQALAGIVGTALAIYGRARAQVPLTRRDVNVRF